MTDLGILGYVLLVLVIWSPQLNRGLQTPRTAVVLVGLGPGLVVVAGLVRRGDVAARWGIGFLVWALVAAVASGAPRLAILGSYSSDVGWIYLAGYVAAWGLGRRLSVAGRRVLPGVLLAGVGTNALVGVLQAALEPGGALTVVDGRVQALTANGLFLAGLLFGGLGLAARLIGGAGRRWALGLPVVALLMAATNLTGSRASLVGGPLLAVVGCVVGALGHGGRVRLLRHDRAIRVRAAGRVGAVVGALALGLLLSVPLQAPTSGTGRVADVSGGGYGSRAEMWGIAIDATAERPVLGWGPGRFRAATAHRTTASFVRSEGPDKLFYDAHNVLIEQLTTTGVVGAVLFVGFAWSIARRCRGPLPWFAAGVAATWLVNPPAVSTAPAVMAALGGSWVASRDVRWSDEGAPAPERHVGYAIGAVLLVVGLLAGSSLLVADRLLDEAVRTRDVTLVRRAERLLPPDPVLADVETQALAAVISPQAPTRRRAAVLAAAERTVRLDPTRSASWARLGYAEADFGPGDVPTRLDRAERAFEAALERSPWSVAAMEGMRAVAVARARAAGDGTRAKAGALAEARRWSARICSVVACPPSR